MISFSANTIPNAIRIAKTPPEAPTVGLFGRRDMAVRHDDRGDCCTYYPKENNSTKRREPTHLQRRAKHPKSEHVAEPMPKTGMKEAVSHNLPNPAVSHVARIS